MLSQIACLARDRTLPVSVCDRVTNLTPQKTAFGRSPVSGRSSYTLFQGGLPTALLTIPLRDAVWPLTFMLAHKAVPHGCCHLLFTTMCSTIPTSPAMTPVSPHGAAGEQKQTAPPDYGTPSMFPLPLLPRLGPKWCRDTICFHRLPA